MKEAFKTMAEQKKGLEMEYLKKGEKYVKGNRYYNGYWDETHRILDTEIDDCGIQIVTSMWEDGNITKHFTALNYKKDFLIKECI